MDERGSAMVQAIVGVVLVAIALVFFGFFLNGMQSTQTRPLGVDAQAPNVGDEIAAVLLYDNSLAVQSALQGGSAATFPVAGGGQATVSIQGGQALVSTPTGAGTVPLVSQAGGT